MLTKKNSVKSFDSQLVSPSANPYKQPLFALLASIEIWNIYLMCIKRNAKQPKNGARKASSWQHMANEVELLSSRANKRPRQGYYYIIRHGRVSPS